MWDNRVVCFPFGFAVFLNVRICFGALLRFPIWFWYLGDSRFYVSPMKSYRFLENLNSEFRFFQKPVV